MKGQNKIPIKEKDEDDSIIIHADKSLALTI